MRLVPRFACLLAFASCRLLADDPDAAHLSLAMRLRAETVEDTRLADRADAETLRLHARLESPRLLSLRAVAGVELTDHLGAQRYDDTLNGQTHRAVIPDPDSFELDEAYLEQRSRLGDVQADAWLGRHWLMFGNQRHVGGGPGWRNNFQSYDGLGLQLRLPAQIQLQVAHVIAVHRALGSRSPSGTVHLDGEFVQCDAPIGSRLTGSLYGFWIAFGDEPPWPSSASQQTQGLSLNWIQPLAPAVRLGVRGELAFQSGYRAGGSGNDARYRQVAVTLTHGAWQAELAHEHLGGDGETAFQTPLAALHFFNGHADRWLRTPARGLDDQSVGIGWQATVPRAGMLFGTSLRYHHYRAVHQPVDYGDEWDAQALAVLGKQGRYGRVMIKLADYRGAGGAPAEGRGNTRKLWLQWDWQPVPRAG